MIYTEATMMHWPRLLHAARAINPAVADALQGYMLAGGQFTPQGKSLFPSGTMTVENAERFKAEKFEPNRKVIVQAVNAAKSADHPWVPGVLAAWTNLAVNVDAYCHIHKVERNGLAGLVIGASNLFRLLDMMAQAILVGGALHHAGFEEQDERLEIMAYLHRDLLPLTEAAGKPYSATGKAVPIGTPDGRLWLVDWYGLKPEGWQEGEMRLLESDLGVALQKFDGVERWWLEEGPETRPKEQQQTA